MRKTLKFPLRWRRKAQEEHNDSDTKQCRRPQTAAQRWGAGTDWTYHRTSGKGRLKNKSSTKNANFVVWDFGVKEQANIPKIRTQGSTESTVCQQLHELGNRPCYSWVVERNFVQPTRILRNKEGYARWAIFQSFLSLLGSSIALWGIRVLYIEEARVRGLWGRTGV